VPELEEIVNELLVRHYQPLTLLVRPALIRQNREDELKVSESNNN